MGGEGTKKKKTNAMWTSSELLKIRCGAAAPVPVLPCPYTVYYVLCELIPDPILSHTTSRPCETYCVIVKSHENPQIISRDPPCLVHA